MKIYFEYLVRFQVLASTMGPVVYDGRLSWKSGTDLDDQVIQQAAQKKNSARASPFFRLPTVDVFQVNAIPIRRLEFEEIYSLDK
jgi:hypothetical protein